jgi:hypothetical protein
MPIEIKVEPPCITISQGRTFMVTNSAGEIDPQTDVNHGCQVGSGAFSVIRGNGRIIKSSLRQ